MQSKTRIQIAMAAACAALVVALALWLVAEEGPSEARPSESARVESAKSPGAPSLEKGAPPIAAADGAGDRESIGETERPAAQPTIVPDGVGSSGEKVRGRVVDARNRPVAGIGIFVGSYGSTPARGIRPVSFAMFGLRENPSGGFGAGREPDVPHLVAHSGGSGRFEVPPLPDGSVLQARSEMYAPVMVFNWYASDPVYAEPLLVVAPPAAVAGVVVDGGGKPLAGVEIAVRAPEELESSLGLILDRAEPLEYFTRSGDDGRFEIADAPGVEGRHLIATLPSGPSQGQPLAVGPETQLRIVFQLEQEFHAAARGIVLDAQGAPAAEAYVRLGSIEARSGADGRFVLDATVAQEGDDILAHKPGFAPGRAPYKPREDETVLRLGPPTLRISGRVVDGGGRPMPSVEVRALGLTRVGGLALEDLSTWEGQGPFTQADTDEQGRFEIGGLEPRSYVLGLLDRSSLRNAQSESIQAGRKDVEIRFRSGDPLGRIAGVVVDRGGAPVPSAEVRFIRDIEREAGRRPESIETGTQTDGSGRFEMLGVALDVRAARVAFPDDAGFEHEIEPGQDLGNLVLVAYRRAHVQVDLTGSDLQADGMEVHDSAGRGLSIVKYEGNTSMAMLRWPITGERSDTLTALDAAESVVLFQGSSEVARIPVQLVPGEVTIVRP